MPERPSETGKSGFLPLTLTGEVLILAVSWYVSLEGGRELQRQQKRNLETTDIYAKASTYGQDLSHDANTEAILRVSGTGRHLRSDSFTS